MSHSCSHCIRITPRMISGAGSSTFRVRICSISPEKRRLRRPARSRAWSLGPAAVTPPPVPVRKSTINAFQRVSSVVAPARTFMAQVPSGDGGRMAVWRSLTKPYSAWI